MSVLSLDADENPSLGGGASAVGVAQTIVLISKEGHRLPVARQALMMSELCKTTLEGDRDATEIPLYHIEGPIVAKVIEYLTYHTKVAPRRIEKPLHSSNMLDLVDRWDAAFIDNGEGPASTAEAAQAAARAAQAAAQAAAGLGGSGGGSGSSAPSASSASSSSSSPSGSAPATAASAAAMAAAVSSAPSAAAQEVLFKLLLAANYLNIRPLLQLACARVATLVRGRTPDQIRAVFNIRNDFTQAEEEEVRKEYKDLIG